MAHRQAFLVSADIPAELKTTEITYLVSSDRRHSCGLEIDFDPLFGPLFDAFRSFSKVVPLRSTANEQWRIQFGGCKL